MLIFLVARVDALHNNGPARRPGGCRPGRCASHPQNFDKMEIPQNGNFVEISTKWKFCADFHKMEILCKWSHKISLPASRSTGRKHAYHPAIGMRMFTSVYPACRPRRTPASSSCEPSQPFHIRLTFYRTQVHAQYNANNSMCAFAAAPPAGPGGCWPRRCWRSS